MLSSVKGVSDELIIVDTGSADATKEIARQFIDKVFNFEWVVDFASNTEWLLLFTVTSKLFLYNTGSDYTPLEKMYKRKNL